MNGINPLANINEATIMLYVVKGGHLWYIRVESPEVLDLAHEFVFKCRV